MDDEKKDKNPDDVSGMTAEERYAHVQKKYADHQAKAKSMTPHDLRMAEKKNG